MTDLEGKISIRLRQNAANDGPGVEVISTRPVLASKVLIGKSPAQALKLVPLMFNICGNAQARTAVSAVGNALGGAPDPQLEIARDILVLAENAREHLFRIFIDWPRLFDVPVDNGALHPLGSMITQFRQALFADDPAFNLDSRLQPDYRKLSALAEGLEFQLREYVLQIGSDDWLALASLADLDAWIEDSDSVAARSTRVIREQAWSAQAVADCSDLPPLDSGELAQRLDADDADRFIAQPDWQGGQHESTPYSRQAAHPLIAALRDEFGPGLLARWMARLVELASIPRQLQELVEHLPRQETGTASAGAASGIAMTEAARGRLIHRVRIDAERIASYQILAPTEWNFHPRGLISQALGNIDESDPQRRETLARLVINTIDPCVGYDLSLA